MPGSSVIRDVRVNHMALGHSHRFADHLPVFEWEVLLIRIQTEGGAEGISQPTAMHGEARSVGQFVLDVLRPILLGQDARFPERIYHHMIAALYALPKSAVWPVDIALWDLAAKLAGIPLFQMFGGYRDRIHAYASTPRMDTADEYVDFSRGLLDQGFVAIKLHGNGVPDKDIEVCRAVREAVGPTVELMLDVVGGYGHDRRQSVRVGRELESLDFAWLEHPLVETDINGYREVCGRLDIPVAGPDGLTSPDEIRAFLAQSATDIIRPNAEFQGGLTGQRRLAHLAEGLDIRCEPHTHGSVISQHANLHGICAIPSCQFFEIPVPLGLLDVLTTTIIRPDDAGYVSAPQGPGLGVELDMDQVSELTTELRP
jgi:L-alanine-DL-glutamate epimerase-like enolase superfamily enzyme